MYLLGIIMSWNVDWIDYPPIREVVNVNSGKPIPYVDGLVKYITGRSGPSDELRISANFVLVEKYSRELRVHCDLGISCVFPSSNVRVYFQGSVNDDPVAAVGWQNFVDAEGTRVISRQFTPVCRVTYDSSDPVLLPAHKSLFERLRGWRKS